MRSNTCTLQWLPRSGQLRNFPEVDRAGWFTLGEAQLHPGQRPLFGQLRTLSDAAAR